MQTLQNELTPQQNDVLQIFLKKNPAPFFDFQLVDAASPLKLLDNENVAHPTPVFRTHGIQGEATVASPEGSQVHLVYSKTTKRVKVNGSDVLEQVPEQIWFESGRQSRLSVPRNQTALLARLLFSDECENGINPAKAMLPSGPVYQLIQPEKTAAEVATERRFRLQVQNLIDQNSDDENKLVAQRLQALPSHKFSFNYSDPNGLLGALLDAVEVDADAVYRATTDSTTKTVALINQAVAADVIRFVPESREWKYVDNDTSLQILPTGDPVQGLAAWFSDAQGQPAFRAIQKVLEAKSKGTGEKKKGIKVAPGEEVPEGYNPKPGKLGFHYPLDQE